MNFDERITGYLMNSVKIFIHSSFVESTSSLFGGDAKRTKILTSIISVIK
jgi:hypothetical protein